MEREKFEESFKRAFDEAGISPSAKVWTNVELELERARGGDLKRRLLFYQMLAAASVVFAMAIGGVGYYYAFDNDVRSRNATIAQNDQNPQDASAETIAPANERSATGQGTITPDEEPSDVSVNVPTTTSANESPIPLQDSASLIADNKGNSAGERSVQETTPGSYTRTNERNTSTDLLAATRLSEGNIPIDEPTLLTGDEAETHPVLPLQVDDTRLPELYAARDVRLNFELQKQEVDPVVAMLAMLEQREREVRNEDGEKEEDAIDTENLWTSIGFAAGSFNAMRAPSASGSSGSASRLAMAAAPIVDQESKATGYSYSMGVNVGTRISERWVLQGGVNYLTQASEYTADNVVVDGPGFLMSAEKYKPITTNAIVSAESEYDLSNSIVYSAPYNVNNSMRYLSIPVQAGYLLVNKTFGLQLNAGVATDLFLQNTVKGDGEQLGETTQSLGADSPYRTVNLSGLFGTEVSYRFGPHYRVSLNPGIRYPFNTIYKSELGVQSSPLTFDVGLRFRYIFH